MENKKLLTAALTCMMTLGSFGFTTLASADSYTTRVEYEYVKPAPSSYTMDIPEKVALHKTDVTELSIKTKERDIRDGEAFVVSLSKGLVSDGKISMKLEDSIGMFSLESSVTKEDGSPVTMNDRVLGEFSGVEPNETEVTKLFLSAPFGASTKEGKYSTDITFLVSKK